MKRPIGEEQVRQICAAAEDGYGSTDFCGNIGELLEVNFFCFFL